MPSNVAKRAIRRLQMTCYDCATRTSEYRSEEQYFQLTKNKRFFGQLSGNQAFTVTSYAGQVSFHKPFKAVPIKLGEHYRQKHRASDRRAAVNLFVIAGVAGASIGLGSVALSEDGRSQLSQSAKTVSTAAGIIRAREPQVGDYWRRCADAKAAGSAPIYIGEPGYRDGLDGDSDGIACEPYRGR